ncbi:AhpD-like protein [Auriculariales sp. MPI-PUGE-AT-0066]|nr:AhpD-like protein [Auriculariales sp. MPI-PUGE-AT-0066]
MTLASRTFLSRIKSLYPAVSGSTSLQQPWHRVAPFQPPRRIPPLYRLASEELTGGEAEQLLLVRKMRDAIFQAGLSSGYPRAINALIALREVTPDHLCDVEPLRDISHSIEDLHEEGLRTFRKAYGDTADAVDKLLYSAYPDLGFFSRTIGYGFTYSFNGVLDPKEFSFAIVSASICTDTPRQTEWHLSSALRNGATREEVQAVRQIVLEVAEECGVQWRNEVPEVPQQA